MREARPTSIVLYVEAENSVPLIESECGHPGTEGASGATGYRATGYGLEEWAHRRPTLLAVVGGFGVIPERGVAGACCCYFLSRRPPYRTSFRESQ